MWFYRITSYEWQWPYISPNLTDGEWIPVSHNEFVYPEERVHRIEFKDDLQPFTQVDESLDRRQQHRIPIEDVLPIEAMDRIYTVT